MPCFIDNLAALEVFGVQAVPVSIYFITAFEIVGGSGRKVVLNR